MARFHTSANDRSWHTADKRTKEALQRHAELTAEYIKSGMSPADASKQAFIAVTTKTELTVGSARGPVTATITDWRK